MSLAAPKLDDRHFQDIVDEAKKLIPRYHKDWTDHNVSDPGVTLIELFAWMTDMILYRMNKIPDRHYVKFLELLGMTLREPEPARVNVTFWLTASPETPLVIPAGTEVATTQTESEPPIIFTVDSDFRARPPDLRMVATRKVSDTGDHFEEHNTKRVQAGFEGFAIFSQIPEVDDALYLGFQNDLSHHILGLTLECSQGSGAGIDPNQPPYVLEALVDSLEDTWQPCDVDIDTTRGLNTSGVIRIHLPELEQAIINFQDLHWVRIRNRQVTSAEQALGMRPYQSPPRIEKLEVGVWGGTTYATHAQYLDNEYVGQSDGSAGQRFQLQAPPILTRKPNETLLLQQEDGTSEVWMEVPDFAESKATDKHYTLESITGEIRFGPAIRQRDGTMKLYGAIPPRSANLFFRRYRHDGGEIGNVQPGALNTLKTSIPYISRVNNRWWATGGLDAESLDDLVERAPALLRSRDRAVTEADFEFLAMEALPAKIGRIRCLQPRPSEGRVAPGQVYVLVIPRVRDPRAYIPANDLEPEPEDIRLLTEYLDDRRLLTTRLDVRPPAYHWVSVRVRVRAQEGVAENNVRRQIVARLNEFLNPLVGGTEGKGWPFGRHLFPSDVYQSMQGMPGLMFVRSVEIFSARQDGRAQGPAQESIEVVSHGVIASGLHTVEFV